jgi:hypothetical protein
MTYHAVEAALEMVNEGFDNIRNALGDDCRFSDVGDYQVMTDRGVVHVIGCLDGRWYIVEMGDDGHRKVKLR